MASSKRSRTVPPVFDEQDEPVESVSALIDRLTFDAGNEQVPADAGTLVRRPAFDRILVAVDDSAASRNGVAWARTVGRAFSSRVTCVHVLEPPTLRAAFAPGYEPDRAERRAKAVVEESAEPLRDAGIPAASVLLKGFVVRRVVAQVLKEDSDLVIVGSKGAGPWSRFLMGSVADGLKNTVPRSILIARNVRAPRRILVAVDGSRESKVAAQVGALLAQKFGAQLTFLYVVPSRVSKEPPRNVLRAVVDLEARFRVGDLRPRLEIAVGRPAESILQRARHGKSDLIVLGSRGLTGLRAVVPGGVSNRAAHAAPCSVLLIKSET